MFATRGLSIPSPPSCGFRRKASRMVANPPSYLTARLAVEALRNGVPNREAVRELGCNQPRAEQRFVDMLEGTADVQNRPGAAPGMLVSGDFGAGKSHLLEHLKHLALSRTSFAAGSRSARKRLCTTWGKCSRRRWKAGGYRTEQADLSKSFLSLLNRSLQDTRPSQGGPKRLRPMDF